MDYECRYAVRTKTASRQLESQHEDANYAEKFVQRTKLLNVNRRGAIFQNVDTVCENDDVAPYIKHTSEITQKDILRQADILTQSKSFDLNLNFGPYGANYTRNGRNLLLYGERGHLAGFDWQTKSLFFEINVMERIRCARWLHNESFIAVSQKEWTYVYDKQGVEIHCLKTLHRVKQMDFLPYHFLLVTLSKNDYINYLDVTMGKIVSSYLTRKGPISTLTHNPANAISITGHTSGIVSMWSPNCKTPLVQMDCHVAPITAVAVSRGGGLLATAACDGVLKIWELRNFGLLATHKIMGTTQDNLTFSQTGLLALAIDKKVKVLKNVTTDSVLRTDNDVYMKHQEVCKISSISFCPYEDILGVGHSQGFGSLIIPGSGEANFDGFESNPYQTVSQRKQWEVKALLNKIPHDLITLENAALGEIDVESAVMQAKADPYRTAKKISVRAVANKMRGKSKISKKLLRKRKMREQQLQEIIKSKQEVEENEQLKLKVKTDDKPDIIFGRFKKSKAI